MNPGHLVANFPRNSRRKCVFVTVRQRLERSRTLHLKPIYEVAFDSTKDKLLDATALGTALWSGRKLKL